MTLGLQCILAGLGVGFLVLIVLHLRHFKRDNLMPLITEIFFLFSILLYFING